MNEDRIISALIGLAGACENNPKTNGTDALVIKALAFPHIFPEYDNKMLQDLIDDIHSEKFSIAPGCAECQFPCGNTSDYDMRRIYRADEGIREKKLQLLSNLQNLATFVYRNPNSNENPYLDTDFFYKVLLYVSYDMEEAALLTLLEEAEQMERRLKLKEVSNDKENHKN